MIYYYWSTYIVAIVVVPLIFMFACMLVSVCVGNAHCTHQ